MARRVRGGGWYTCTSTILVAITGARSLRKIALPAAAATGRSAAARAYRRNPSGARRPGRPAQSLCCARRRRERRAGDVYVYIRAYIFYRRSRKIRGPRRNRISIDEGGLPLHYCTLLPTVADYRSGRRPTGCKK